jgi:hypothetical protein
MHVATTCGYLHRPRQHLISKSSPLHTFLPTANLPSLMRMTDPSLPLLSLGLPDAVLTRRGHRRCMRRDGGFRGGLGAVGGRVAVALRCSWCRRRNLLSLNRSYRLCCAYVGCESIPHHGCDAQQAGDTAEGEGDLAARRKSAKVR